MCSFYNNSVHNAFVRGNVGGHKRFLDNIRFMESGIMEVEVLIISLNKHLRQVIGKVLKFPVIFRG